MFGSLKRPPARLGPWTDRQRPSDGRRWQRFVRHPLAPRLRRGPGDRRSRRRHRVLRRPAGRLTASAKSRLMTCAFGVCFEVVNFPQTEWAQEEFGRATSTL